MTPMTSLAVVVAAVLLLAGALWFIVGLCRAAATGDIDDGRAFGGEFKE
jgi:hypothetical protein